MAPNIRNICTIAHVDHGKTTLVDFLFRQSGTFQTHENIEERVMDTDTLERERGITISAKNAAFQLGNVKVNIVDTPGHADFGGEVERIMGMVDGAILLVDAAEGPLPQTRFVLEKAIKRGLKIILCVNKVDRPELHDSNLINNCVDKTFDLFVELGASEKQCDFPIIYACAKEGWCTETLEEVGALLAKEHPGSLKPLFDLILKLPPPKIQTDKELKIQVSDIIYSDYIGSLALGKICSGALKKNQEIIRHGVDENGTSIQERFVASRLYCFEGMQQVEVDEIKAGDIGLVAGTEGFTIGDTLASSEKASIFKRIHVDAPTMRMIFSINTSPLAGGEGKAIQSRELKARLMREVKGNPALRFEETQIADQFYLNGRGELQFGILIEKMRREGLEFMVGRPSILLEKSATGEILEPVEKLILDLPETYNGDVSKLYQERGGIIVAYDISPIKDTVTRIRLTFEIPTKGLLGTRSRFLTATRGTGILTHENIGHKPYRGEIMHRKNGSLVSDRSGATTAYALFSIQQRGALFVEEHTDLYEGMIIGEHSRDTDLNVNACRAKKLTNVRSTSSDGLIILNGARKMSLEDCIEWIDDDEWIEVTPKNIRLRKKILKSNMRSVIRGNNP